jgi:ribosomal protein S18 acetylase RimI-like enzyme
MIPLAAGWHWHTVDRGSIAAALALIKNAFAGAPVFWPPDDEYESFLLSGQTRSCLLFHGEQPVGFARVRYAPAERLAYLGPIARAPLYRGRGLGDVLVGHALNMVAEDNPLGVHLDVHADNERALALYRRHGFQVSRQSGLYRGEDVSGGALPAVD